MHDALVRDLTRSLHGEVHADDGTRAAYSSDGSNHRVVPAAVVFPRHVDDVSVVVRACAADGIPVTSRGAGTNVAGNALGAGVVLDYSRHMNRIRAVDPEARSAVVEPGVVLDRLQEAVAGHGLRFGPDPSTHDRCTIGGMVGTNACGSHSVAWGTTADNLLDVDVMLADGNPAPIGASSSIRSSLTALREANLAAIRQGMGRFPRQVSGYALQHLLPERGTDLAKAFTGSEGTCGVLTSATIRLVEDPPVRTLVLAAFSDVIRAAAAAPDVAALRPLTVEGIDHHLVRAFDSRPGPQPRPELPRGRAWLLVEVGGAAEGPVREQAEAVVATARAAGALDALVVTETVQQRAFWRIRERGAGLATRTAEGAEAWPGWEDAAVPPDRLAGYLADFRALLREHDRRGVVFGHFGEGCVHVRIDHDLLTPEGRTAYRRFQEEAADLVIGHGGSLSGEHGDGRARSELLSRMYGAELIRAFAGFKNVFDPDGLFNPGVITDPEPLDSAMRFQVNRPHTVDLMFGYQDDDGDWGKAMRRCVGVGSCRKTSGGGMCPSYRATHDEQHSTRGRARLLFEMLHGQLSGDGWRSEAVHSALDLCLACKACANECPVSVDMATYKAEFLHKHYRRRLRPRSHYSLGWLPLWLLAARRAPRVANRLLDRGVVARLAGIDPRRRVPVLAPGRPTMPSPAAPGSRSEPTRAVTLWVDTFTASFAPTIAEDAVVLLEAAGYQVHLAGPDLCCGLTWVSTGQLGIARRVMSRTSRRLDETPGDIVALEPSCAASLRGDLPDLVSSPAAHRVAERVRTLAEVIEPASLDLEPLRGAAVAQFHCHQRAVLGTGPDRRLLERLGVALTSVEEGCCGLAGNFGFEPGHHEVSVACAEQSFQPALREQPEAPVLADGFSCRLQIEQLGGRTAVHLAGLLRGQLRGQLRTDVAG